MREALLGLPRPRLGWVGEGGGATSTAVVLAAATSAALLAAARSASAAPVLDLAPALLAPVTNDCCAAASGPPDATSMTSCALAVLACVAAADVFLDLVSADLVVLELGEALLLATAGLATAEALMVLHDVRVNVGLPVLEELGLAPCTAPPSGADAELVATGVLGLRGVTRRG